MRNIKILFASLVLASSLSACQKPEEDTNKKSNLEQASQELNESLGIDDQTYQNIYETYAEKLETQGNQLVEKFLNEIPNLTTAQEREELYNTLSQELEKTWMQGQDEMFELLYANEEDKENYDNYLQQMQDIYNNKQNELENAYMTNLIY